eukprot:1142591-Rhodomonas_salina.1
MQLREAVDAQDFEGAKEVQLTCRPMSADLPSHTTADLSSCGLSPYTTATPILLRKRYGFLSTNLAYDTTRNGSVQPWQSVQVRRKAGESSRWATLPHFAAREPAAGADG